MLRSAAVLIRERGARATSIDDVLRHSEAPRGSVYHHFPGGRRQLIAEATEHAAGYVEQQMRLGAARLEPAEAFDAVISSYRRQLLDTGFRAGCPVAAVAVEAPQDEEEPTPLDAAARGFASWQAVLRDHYVDHGASSDAADELALTVIAAVEGALILCRAQRDIAPLDAVHHQLRPLLENTP